MLDQRRLPARLVVGCLLLGALTMAFTGHAQARCRAKNIKKIRKLTKQALEDYQMLEVKSALKRITRAIDHGIDNDCDEKLVHARALMVRGIIHLAGQQDAMRGKLYMRKAIKANPCVKLESNQPPNVVKVWKKIRRKLRRLKCKGGVRPPPVEPDPPPTDTKPCTHTAVEEIKAGTPVQIVVGVSPDLGATKVIVFFRPHGKAAFSKLMLAKPASGRSWTGSIPGTDVRGTRLAYYIEVRNASGTVLCMPTRANAGAPEIIMVKGDPCKDLPPDFCESNAGHKCCKTPRPRPGPGPGPGPRGTWPRFYLSLGGSLGAGLLTTGMKSDLAVPPASPYEAGFAIGPIGGQAEFGYFIARSHLLSLAGRFGVVFSDLSDNPVVSFQVLLRYRFFVIGGGRKDLFSLYLGVEAGGTMLYHSLLVPTEDDGNKKDTFEHGFVMVGAIFGIQIGTQKVAWYVEVDPVGVFPNQSTFHLGISTGIALRF